MINTESQEYKDVCAFVNLNPNQKLRWVNLYPDRAVYMIDYLVNITKDI